LTTGKAILIVGGAGIGLYLLVQVMTAKKAPAKPANRPADLVGGASGVIGLASTLANYFKSTPAGANPPGGPQNPVFAPMPDAPLSPSQMNEISDFQNQSQAEQEANLFA
jgi:hypothetical protein